VTSSAGLMVEAPLHNLATQHWSSNTLKRRSGGKKVRRWVELRFKEGPLLAQFI